MAVFTSSLSQRCFSTTWSSVSIAHHWKGVCGFGTWVETLTVTIGGPALLFSLRTRFPTSRARLPTFTISRTSASSSVGRPIMK